MTDIIRTIPHIKPVLLTDMKPGDKYLNGEHIMVMLGWSWDAKERDWMNIKAIHLNAPGEPRFFVGVTGQRCLKYLGEVVPRRTNRQ